jgi:hypothetical protein
VSSAPRAASGPLVLADISGYTVFLQSVAFAHRDDAFAGGAVPDAYEVISGLLDGIVGRLVPPFVLSKLEGDAVFAYAEDGDPIPRGLAALDCIHECYADFRNRVEDAQAVRTCWCGVCSRLDELDLKFVVHYGHFVVQDIAGGSELVGPEVVVAHRLLKSGAVDLIGHTAYALVTRAAAAALDLPDDGSLELVERYDDAPVSARVYALRNA